MFPLSYRVSPAVTEAQNILASRSWPSWVTGRHQSCDYSICHIPFPLPIGGPLEPSLYLYFQDTEPQHMLTNTNRQTNEPTNQQRRRITILPDAGNYYSNTVCEDNYWQAATSAQGCRPRGQWGLMYIPERVTSHYTHIQKVGIMI